MKFKIEHSGKDNTTFSDMGLLAFINQFNTTINEIITKAILDGFDKKNPVKSLEIELEIKANNKLVDWDSLLEQYPEQVSLDLKALANSILEKAGKEKI